MSVRRGVPTATSEVATDSGPLDDVPVGPIAHGGHCVARIDGRVIFVRHTLPGERVRVVITDDSSDRFWRADAMEILEPHPERVPLRCPIAGPGQCGGCDFQHVSLAEQRRLKAAVVAEQLLRLAGVEWTGVVEEVATPETADGLDWRTRMRYHVDDEGRAGLRAHRSHEVIPLPETGCPIASPRAPSVVHRRWPPGGGEVDTVTGADGTALLVDGRLREGTAVLTERAGGRDFTVAADGFWQVHPAAADILAAAVVAGLDPQTGERAFDLYCGVGLFSAVLADHGCRVWGVELAGAAVEHARKNVPEARFSAGRVERVLPRLPKRTDLVVLDPPRSGAARRVMEAVISRRPRAIAYVACDPAALARDLSYASALGYEPRSIRAFDLFPMTHHVECVAILEPARPE
jgi:tRNA/tmRNA/rRNA uracil-C5-methylase (TrmA/RlmC/RlmD family)